MNLYARHRLDLTSRDLAAFASCCVAAEPRHRLTGAITERWGAGAGLVTLSVRSAFDLLLTALDLPPGSEILATAITIPDMVKVAEAHGLVVLPLDLAPDTLLPTRATMDRALGSKTRLLLAAHLFGGRLDLRPLAQFCRQHGLLLIEDAAQGFLHADDFGTPEADVSMFSLGIIKTATALGGGLVRIADPLLKERMVDLQADWPAQEDTVYRKRLVRCTLMAGLTHGKWRYGALSRLLGGLGLQLDAVVSGWAKGFPRRCDAELLTALRQRPSTSLLAAIHYRLGHVDVQRIGRRAEAGEWIAARLGLLTGHPGAGMPCRTHWLFPVTTAQPNELARRLRAEGFDAAQGTTSIAAIPAPAHRPELHPHRAAAMLRHMLFIPVYPEIGAGELARLAGLLESEPVSEGTNEWASPRGFPPGPADVA